MNLFPITHRLSCKIYESRVPRGHWKQIHLKHDKSNFFPKADSRKFHPWLEKCHPWMSSIDGEMSSMDRERSSMDGKMSSMDGSDIGGCHPWMTLPSVDEDDDG